VPVEIPDYKVTPELIDKLNEYLEVFKGTNNFFNYTIRMDKNDASAKRYIISFKVEFSPPARLFSSPVPARVCGLNLSLTRVRAVWLLCSALDRSPSTEWNSCASRSKARASCCTRSAA
jgi:tRNA pseudouridine38-40 synthase